MTHLCSSSMPYAWAKSPLPRQRALRLGKEPFALVRGQGILSGFRLFALAKEALHKVL